MKPLDARSCHKVPEQSGGSLRHGAIPVCLVAWVGLGVCSPASLLAVQDAAAKPKAAKPAATASSPHSAPTAESNSKGIRVKVEVVNIPVSVLDRRGLPVIDMTQNDFRIYEDGKPQSMRYFRREPPLPLRIGLILDTSNSARRQLSFEKDAAGEFVFNMLQGRKSINQIYLQTFDATSSVAQDFTNDPEVLNEKITDLKAGGGKALYDAIYFACKEKMLKAGPPENTRRVLVLVSDGLDVQSTHTRDEVISMAHRAETAIYAIGNTAYGFSNPGDKLLAYLAGETGGRPFFPLEQSPGADLGSGYLSHGQIGDTSQNTGLGAATGVFSATRLIHLADSLEAISRELNEQYNLGYTPTHDALDGTYRAIRVLALRKGVTVRAKPGYFAVPE